MNYSELIEVMHQFRAGTLTRSEMVAALALWQRPVEVARAWANGCVSRWAAAKYQIKHDTVFMALEGIIK